MAYHHQYSAPPYPPQQSYSDEPFNPYDIAAPQRMNEQFQDAGYGGGYRDEPVAVPTSKEQERERSVFEDSPITGSVEPKSSGAMRRWRREHQGNLWTRGGGGRCFGRFFCCTLMIFLFLLISIILSLALWIRPPNIQIGDVSLPPSNGIQLTSDGVTINLGVPISVQNPNYFSVNFQAITAELFYPINNTLIGGGTASGVDIKHNEQTNFTLPFALTYSEKSDPNFKILTDIATRCGYSGQATQDITVDYKIHLAFKILFIPIKPVVSNSFSFACPLTEAQLADLLKSAGLDLGKLGTLLKLFL